MSNPYLTKPSDLLPGELAKAQQVNDRMTATDAAFDAVLADINLRLGSNPSIPALTNATIGTLTVTGAATFNSTVTVPSLTATDASTNAANMLTVQAAISQRAAEFGTLGDLVNVIVTTSGTGTTNTRELCRAASAIERTLPSGAGVNAVWGYKDDGQDFSTNKLTLTPPSGHRFEWAAVDEAMEVTTRGESGVLCQTSAGVWRFIG